jgi:hypothetical protein
MKTGTGIQAIIRVFLKNFIGRNVGVTDGRFNEGSRGEGSGAIIYIPRFIDWFRYLEVDGAGGYTYRHTYIDTQTAS